MKLIFVCGKMAAGKSTLARELAQQEDAVLLVEDELLDRLFPGEIADIAAYVKCSSRLKNALAPLAGIVTGAIWWRVAGGQG
ncbi:MAG TPA: AAA family ATPase [Vicinamibacterales bacterium]|nr:AAA family ATPase [Vicinamibacterales bacterium]